MGDNTNQFHDTVELLARMSADQGVSIDLTDTDGVKEAGHYKEGYITNGYVTDDGKITLNYDSPNTLEFIVGHEITHVLEKAGSYSKVQESIFEYAKTKEGLERFNARLEAAKEAYAGKKNTTPEGEVCADLIGEYLFGDYEFVRNLAKTDSNNFQTFWDNVKHLYKMAVAGSKEARQLEKAKRMFERAYNEEIKGKADSVAESDSGNTQSEGFNKSGVQLSYATIDGIGYVKAEKNIFIKEDGTTASEREVFDSLVGKTIPFPDGEVEIVSGLPGKNMYKELFTRYPKAYGGIDDIKQLNSDVNYNMEELLANSTMKDPGVPDHDNRHQKQGITHFDSRTVKFYDGNKAYNIQFNIGILQDGRKVAYAKKFFGYDEELTKKYRLPKPEVENLPRISNLFLALK